MKLFARFLVWFALNLLLLVAGFVGIIRWQFDRDFLLTAGAADRLEILGNTVAGKSESDLAPYETKYNVRFHIYDSHGHPLAGDPRIPAEVHSRANRPRPPRHLPPPPETGPEQTSRTLIRAGNPPRYWAIVRAANQTAVVIESDSLTGSGLFLDLKPWLAALFGAALLSALFWLPFIRRITQSVAQMEHATQQIAEGRFDVRVDATRRDELGALGTAINQMATRLDGFVTGQKRFLGDIAHELCAPVAKLRLALDLHDLPRADAKAKEIANLVNELLAFSKTSVISQQARLQPVNLRQLCATAAEREGAEVALDIPENLLAAAEPELLTRALANLLRNALRYAPGPITITGSMSGREIELIVADTGPGIPDAELTRIFDPFYRLDTSRDRETGGVGLGLAIVKTCVEACRGRVFATNRQPTGLAVTIVLPATAN